MLKLKAIPHQKSYVHVSSLVLVGEQAETCLFSLITSPDQLHPIHHLITPYRCLKYLLV